MLFNSYGYIFLFLPIVVIGFYLIGGRGHHRVATSWLVGMSFVFYGWWNAAYLLLIVSSILVNYSIGVMLGRRDRAGKKRILVTGIIFNLGLLGYYKYANFFIGTVNTIIESNIVISQIILPLAISFFTFQQIAFLVDAYQGETREYNFLHYCLFVTFFPQLIAGPIVHHKEMLPQFSKEGIYRFRIDRIGIGSTIFIIGLMKKVVLADNVSSFANPVFDAAEGGAEITLLDGWIAALAYTFQLYYDFSGYADMAMGSALLFGIRLPINFNSPYQAINIIDFWRRWHITLSRFLRDYLYIPLGGNRKGKGRRYINLITTMLLGGLWHGAGWNFVIWGGLHGFYLVINHAWHWAKARLGIRKDNGGLASIFLSWCITFIAVVISWVFFRAESFDGAIAILRGMLGLNGIVSAEAIFAGNTDYANVAGLQLTGLGTDIIVPIAWLATLLFIAVLMPNSVSIMRLYKPVVTDFSELRSGVIFQKLAWRPNWRWGVSIGMALILGLVFMMSPTEFLYWQF